MSRQGQRYRQHASTLALSSFLALGVVLAGCSSSTDALDGATPSEPAESSPAPDAGASDQTNDLPDGSPITPPSTTPAEESNLADLSIAADLAGLIAFRDGNGDLVTSRPDGTQATVWASGDQFANSQPTWSATGEQLAWTAIGPEGPTLAITSVGSADTEAVSFTPVASPQFYLSWSPDNTWIASLGNGPTGIELTIFESAAGEQRVVGPGQPFFTDWSSNGTIVAAIGGQALVDINANDLAANQRNLDAQLGIFSTPVALSETEAIVALRNGPNNEIVRLDGSTSSVLGAANGPVALSLNPQMSQLAVLVIETPDPEAQTIAFAQPAAPSLPAGVVSIIDLETGAVVSRPEQDILSMRWSPDGNHLALLESTPDGLTWLFADPATATAEPTRSATFFPSQEFANSYLPFADQYDRSTTEWSPNSQAFVFSGTVNDTAGVWIDVIDDDLGPAQLSNGDIAFWSPN